ncbi:MAG: NTP transferase domain-containing protein [Trueperaceae bacterium]|nr:NTP transferase domain-containing protein [Trueperaceae bacterium]
MSDRPAAVVLAAGQGRRMRSSLPKVVHEVAGRPMVAHVVRAARTLGADPVVVVVGAGADRVREALAGEAVAFATQSRPLGTGHAFASAREALGAWAGPVFCLNGDGPTVTAASLEAMQRLQQGGPRPGEGMTLMTVTADDPTGLGRVVRDEAGRVRAIVEEKDASDATRRIREISPGVFLFDATALRRAAALGRDNAQGEAYVTDLPAAYLADGAPVRAYHAEDPREGLAANDRAQLAVLERVMRDRVRARWLNEGVTMASPETTFIDDGVVLAQDVVLEPFVVLKGGTRVGDGARIGAGAHLQDCEVAAGAWVPPHALASEARFG